MRLPRLKRGSGAAPQTQWEWSELAQRKQRMSDEFRASANSATLVQPITPAPNHLELSVADWIRHQVESERYWFQKVELFPGYFSPGWDDPAQNKLPYYGLPDDLTGLRVLDIGCAEGFFSLDRKSVV